MMSEHKQPLSPSSVRRATNATKLVEATPSQAPDQASEFMALQHVIGNYALQRLMADGNPVVPLRGQAKLHVGAANDSYEHEADSVASAVMNMSDASVQRAEDEDEIQAKRVDVQRAEEEELQAKRVDIQRAEEEEELQAKRLDIQRAPVDMMGEFDVAGSVEQGIQQTAGGGQHLPESTRDFFEPRFGHEFENVHVHADNSADSLNRSIQARAFTRGSDIYFASGEYQPESSSGRELLAHELTHVIQQTGGSPKRK